MIVFFVMLFSIPSSSQANWVLRDHPAYVLTGSLDLFMRPLFHSQRMGTDFMLSVGYGIAQLEDQFRLQERLDALHPVIAFMSRLPMLYLLIAQHEFTGHGLQAQFFKRRIEKIFINPFIVTGPSYCRLKPHETPLHKQQSAMISLAGMQANTLFSQTIIDQLFLTRQTKLPSLIGMLYFASLLDQISYVCRDTLINSLRHGSVARGDLSSHISHMQNMYGKETVTLSSILGWSLLDLLNPLLISAWQARSNMSLPWFSLGYFSKLGAIHFLPMTNLLLTPYNVLEKRLILYFDAQHTPLKLTIGWGGERKSNIPRYQFPFPEGLSERGEEFIEKCLKMVRTELFNGATEVFFQPDPISPEEQNTFYLGLDVYRAYTVGQLDIRCSLAGWRQPKLFTKEPRWAPIQWGGLFLVGFTCRFTNQLNGFLDLGYKTSGFLLGYPPKQTALIRGGVRWMMG
jgi:hypothetical protein